MAKKRKWAQKVKQQMEKKGTTGSFRRYCKKKGYSGATQACIEEGKRSRNPRTRKRAVLAENFRKMRRRKKK